MPDGSSLVPDRYCIYWANLDPTVGSELRKVRPVVIVSPVAMNHHLETIVVCPLTSTLHPRWASRVQITCDGQPAEIAVDQIRTISKTRLAKKLDQLDDPAIVELQSVIARLYAN